MLTIMPVNLCHHAQQQFHQEQEERSPGIMYVETEQ